MRVGRRLAARDAGSVTAEVAVALPAVVLVLAACLGGIAAGGARLQAQDAAADAARLLGRGEPASVAASHVARTAPGGRLAIAHDGELVCATVGLAPRVLGVPVPVGGRACALTGGG